MGERGKSPAIVTLELKKLLTTELLVYSLVLCINVNCFSEDKASWQVCLFLGETQGRELVGRNRFISMVGQPSEEVVILKRSQVRWLCSVTELGKQEAGASLRCREQQKHVSSRDVRTRASVQLESGSFLMTELLKGLTTSPHRAAPYSLECHPHCC